MEKYKHIRIKDKIAIPYTPPNGGGRDNAKIPKRDRKKHADYLIHRFNSIWEQKESRERSAISFSNKKGTYIEFKGKKDSELVTKSLEDSRQNVRLCNVREKDDTTFATVFVPEDKKQFFLKKMNGYKEEKSNKKVMDSIEDVNSTIVESFWTDYRKIPVESQESCEVWLSCYKREDPEEIARKFFGLCEQNKILYSEKYMVFPERVVVAIEADKKILELLLLSSCDIAEFRKASIPAIFFIEDNDCEEQSEWVDDLLARVQYEKDTNISICLLDTGVNNAHPLITDFLTDKDMFTVFDDGDVLDMGEREHGTPMAGISIYNNLEKILGTKENVEIKHRLESVRMFDKRFEHLPNLYGIKTFEAVTKVENKNPDYQRVIAMAITTDIDNEGEFKVNDGSPTSWSAMVDDLAYGTLKHENHEKRLIVISAGNTTYDEIQSSEDYKTAVLNHSAEDPSQSWNALTVGAFTEKSDLPKEGSFSEYSSVVESGGYSPFTTSSMMWDKKWPVKPCIVLEGGNLAYCESENFFTETDYLNLLTTSKDFNTKGYFTGFNMTSAATAQAANMSARIMSEEPQMWPETVRALMVHSAEWTDAMKRQAFGTEDIKDLSKAKLRELFRIVGYGVPNLDKALYTYQNSVNFVIEDEIQPFRKKESSTPTMNEMNFYDIPWPEEVLKDLGNIPVKLKITLSYFIDPAPGRIGWTDKYRYPGCRLSFDINNAYESRDEFVERINKKEREKDFRNQFTGVNSERWFFGASNRNNGSIHSDIWEDTAINLAQNRFVSVCPEGGWWKDRTNLKKYNSKIRYSLIMSISTPEQDVDLYTPIMNKIKSKTVIQNKIEY